MPDAHQLLLFILAGWLLNLTPGPDVLYIVRHALREGTRAGIVAGLGITAGCFVHAAAATLGVGALLAASAVAFDALRWLGAGYLLWMGVKLLVAPAGAPTGPAAEAAAPAAAQALPLRTVFLGGFWTNVLNPKVAIFFLAFLPQFIAPDARDKTAAFIALGVLFNVNSIPVNCGWALAAGWMAQRPQVRRALGWLDRAAGALFVSFGLRLALADNSAR